MNHHRTIFRTTDVPGARIVVCTFEAATRRQLEDHAEMLSRENAHLLKCLAGQGRRIDLLAKDLRDEDWHLP